MVKKKKNKIAKLVEAFNKPKLKNAILTVFYDSPEKTYNYKQIAELLKVKDPEITKLVFVVLEELTENGTLQSVQRGKYKLISRSGTICGKVEIKPQGFAFVVSEEVESPVMISSRNLNHAMEGDKVKVCHPQEPSDRRRSDRDCGTCQINFCWNDFQIAQFCLFHSHRKICLRPVYPERKAERCEGRTKSHRQNNRMAGACQEPIWRNH
jgi:exoribonuclease R